MATKLEVRKAYDAGRALPRIAWDDLLGDDATPDQKRLGEHHCPFSEADGDQREQREAWLRGLRDALLDQGDEKDRQALLRRLDANLGEES